MARVVRRTGPAERWPAQARERALREGNAGRPAAAVRHARAGLRYLGWSEGPAEDDARQVPEAHRALAARLLGHRGAVGGRARPHGVRAEPARPGREPGRGR